jgi:hypothetical protein
MNCVNNAGMPVPPRKLTTTTQVVDALGGIEKLRRLVRAKTRQRVSNWVGKGLFPANTADIIREELACLKPPQRAAADLWPMITHKRRKRKKRRPSIETTGKRGSVQSGGGENGRNKSTRQSRTGVARRTDQVAQGTVDREAAVGVADRSAVRSVA